MRRAELFGRRFVRLLPQDFKNGKWLMYSAEIPVIVGLERP